MAKISVTRALTEVKTLQERIQNAIATGQFCGITKGIGPKRVVVGSPRSVETTEADIKAASQKVEDLIRRRLAIKRAILQSNSVTEITIAGETMTVAEAIERRQSIQLDRSYLDTLRMQYTRASTSITAANQKLNEEIERAVQQAYNNDKGKVTAEQYAAVSDPRKAEHEANLLDPLHIVEKIELLTERVNTFIMEADFCLSESNARTEIEVE